MIERVAIVPAAEDHLELVHKLASAGGLSRWSVADYRRQLDDPSRELRVLRYDRPSNHALLGFYLLHHLPPEAELLQFAVHHAQRRRGWGRLMLSALLQSAARRGCSRCELEVRAANRRAIRFYRRNGFEVVSVRAGYYRDPDDDALLMRRCLD